jgi:tetratricopeptide (TPR) repeat protein
MNLRKNSFRVAGILWLVGLTVALAGPRDDFKAANQLYDAGKFAEAAAAYEKIEPKTAHVYYNLGNALFRQDKLGLAVLNYERARELSPRDPDILANLKFAEKRLAVDEANAPSHVVQKFLRSVIEGRTPTEWSVCELAGLWLTALGIGAWIYFPRMRTGLLVITMFGFVGFATSALALSYQIINDHNAPQGIIVVSGADARFAPLPDSTIHFRLVEGAQIVIREDRGQWLLVERPDGQQGWVKAEAIGRITPL